MKCLFMRFVVEILNSEEEEGCFVDPEDDQELFRTTF